MAPPTIALHLHKYTALLLSHQTCTHRRLATSLLVEAIKSIPPARRAGLSFHENVAYQGLRDYQCGLGAVQVQALLPPTSKTCRRWARHHRIPFVQIRLADGTLALWLGARKPKKVTVLFHGGGYMAPALWQHIDMAFGFAKPRDGMAVVVLQYALASEHGNHYPTQLRQAACLLQHLFQSESVQPSSIILLGDSAGGNLLLGLLLHINHPHPSVPMVTLNGRFAGAALISPWVELKSPALSSEKPEAKQDVITPAGLAYWAQNLLGAADTDPWNSPLSAPTEWWGDLPVDEMLVTYGKDELFRDDVSRLGEMIRAAHPHAKVVECEREIHVHMVMNRFLKINKPCRSEREFVGWLAGCGRI